MRVVYVGYAATSCTRALAFLGEAHLISEEVTIRQEGDAWVMVLDFKDEQPPEKIEEIDWQVGDHGLSRVES